MPVSSGREQYLSFGNTAGMHFGKMERMKKTLGCRFFGRVWPTKQVDPCEDERREDGNFGKTEEWEGESGEEEMETARRSLALSRYPDHHARPLARSLLTSKWEREN